MATRRASIERGTAEQRREQVLEAALHEFSLRGFEATTTQAIAQRAGISQAYLFRLFGSKRELFLATSERLFDRVGETLRQAAASALDPAARLQAMGAAYRRLLEDRELLLGQMHMYAACSDPEVQAVARRRYAELFAEVGRVSGAPADQIGPFFAMGMLLNVAAAIDLPEIADPGAWVSFCSPS